MKGLSTEEKKKREEEKKKKEKEREDNLEIDLEVYNIPEECREKWFSEGDEDFECKIKVVVYSFSDIP